MMDRFAMMTPNSDQIVNGAVDAEKLYRSIAAKRC